MRDLANRNGSTLGGSTTRRWIVALTGASGITYGLRLVQELSKRIDELHVIFSEAALRVLAEEEGIKLSYSALSCEALIGEPLGNVQFHNPRDIGASVASGSMIFEGMAIVPCSMATLGAIACGAPQNLVHRAADVCLKEGRKLIIVPRETPLSAIHLENMLKLSRLGVTVLPAMPGFYHQPASVRDLVDMLVMKILDQMGVQNELVRRWNGESAAVPVAKPRRGVLVGMRRDG